MARAKTTLITQIDLMTASALSLEEVFTMEQLTVAVWKLWPHLFCIKGYVEYPDNNRIIVYVTHKKNGAVMKQHMIRKGKGEYSLTQEGRKYAQWVLEELQSGRATVRQPRATISVDVEVST